MMVSGSWVWYFLFLCSLAFVEELLWEYLIWGNYHDDDVDWLAQYMPELSPGCRNATEAEKGADTALECHSVAESAVVALLAVVALPWPFWLVEVLAVVDLLLVLALLDVFATAALRTGEPACIYTSRRCPWDASARC